MVLSPSFYDAVTQIIPVLFLTGVLEMAAIGRRWDPTGAPFPGWVIPAILGAFVFVVGAEAAALWAVSNEAENAFVRFVVLHGLGLAGALALAPVVDHVTDWDEAKSRKWVLRLSPIVVMTPYFIAAVASVVATFYA